MVEIQLVSETRIEILRDDRDVLPSHMIVLFQSTVTPGRRRDRVQHETASFPIRVIHQDGRNTCASTKMEKWRIISIRTNFCAILVEYVAGISRYEAEV
jgi:hypothetical protein